MTESPAKTHLPAGQQVAAQLQQVRQEQSLTLEEVTKATRVSTANLRAIEAMAYEKLPADTFTRGQITLFGNYLGLDGRRLADQFFIERDGGKKVGPLVKKRLSPHCLTAKQLAEPTHISSATIATLLLLFIVLSFTGFCLYTSWNPFAFLTDQTRSLRSSVINTFHPANPATAPPLPKALHLTAKFLKDAQVVVILDQMEAASKTYPKGTSVQWKADKLIQLEFIQPDSAELQVDGSPLAFPPQAGNSRYILRLPPPPAKP